ncbi:MAG TPA: hypothetical protein IAB01_08075 [Candidatus Avidesulfovibrio excrementigallinarum]|nr:hypothetical protein [Candidatus Avidesulfovibrio excrementigallinarum]
MSKWLAEFLALREVSSCWWGGRCNGQQAGSLPGHVLSACRMCFSGGESSRAGLLQRCRRQKKLNGNDAGAMESELQACTDRLCLLARMQGSGVFYGVVAIVSFLRCTAVDSERTHLFLYSADNPGKNFYDFMLRLKSKFYESDEAYFRYRRTACEPACY